MQRVGAERRFHRLVVFRERPFRQLVEGKQASQPFRLHDEWPGVAARRGGVVVRDIVPCPLRPVPLDQHAFRIPRPAVYVCRRAVVQHATVQRPRPCPAQRIAQPGRVGVVAVGHLVALLRPAAGVDPAGRRRRAVIAQQREAVQQLAFLRHQVAAGVIEIRQRHAVVLFGDFL